MPINVRPTNMRLLMALLPAVIGFQGKVEDPDLVNARKTLIPDLIAALREPAYYSEAPFGVGSNMVRTGTFSMDSPAMPDNMWIGSALRAIGKPAVPALIKALESDNEQVLEEVTEVLRHLKAKESLPALKAAYIRVTKPFPKLQLLATLAEVGRTDAFDFVLQALDKDNVAQVLDCLGDTKDPRAIATLEKYLFQGDANDLKNLVGLDRTAAFALVTIGKPALPLLTRAYHSSNKRLRIQIGDALGHAEDPAFIPLLLEALESPEALAGQVDVGGLRHKPVMDSALAMLASNELPRQLVAVRAMEYSSLDQKRGFSRYLLAACKTAPGDDPKSRKELLQRLADLVRSENFQQPNPAIRTAIEWMIGPGGYATWEVAPLVDTYSNHPEPGSLDLLLRLAQMKTPIRESDDGLSFRERMSMSIESAAAAGIGRLGRPAIEKLRDLLDAGKVPGDIYCLAIAYCNDKGALNLFLDAVASPNEVLAEYGLRSLAEVDLTPEIEALLLKHVKDPRKRLSEAAMETLIELGHKDSIRSFVRSNTLTWSFKSIIGSLDTDFLKELFPIAKISVKSPIAAELVNRNEPGSKEMFIALARAVKPQQSDVAEALVSVNAKEELFRKCLTVKSTYVRSVAYLRLSRLLQGDKEAYPYQSWGERSGSNRD